MRVLLALTLVLLASCGEADKPAPPKFPWLASAPVPRNETLRFPPNDQVSVTLVEDHILGYEFLPGGSLGLYKKGTKEYKLFLVKLASGQSPAALLEFKNRLEGAKFVANFGGYEGLDRGTPVFVFTKGVYLLGIVGLTPEEADPIARYFAGRVN